MQNNSYQRKLQFCPGKCIISSLCNENDTTALIQPQIIIRLMFSLFFEVLSIHAVPFYITNMDGG